MNQNIKFVRRHIITLLVATFAITTTIASGKGQIFLGPPESGTWSGSEEVAERDVWCGIHVL